MRRQCALLEKEFPYRMRVDSEQCTGCELCAKVFKCPGLVWDDASEKAQIDEVLCVGCGLCADVCPQAAIIREEVG